MTTISGVFGNPFHGEAFEGQFASREEGHVTDVPTVARRVTGMVYLWATHDRTW